MGSTKGKVFLMPMVRVLAGLCEQGCELGGVTNYATSGRMPLEMSPEQVRELAEQARCGFCWDRGRVVRVRLATEPVAEVTP